MAAWDFTVPPPLLLGPEVGRFVGLPRWLDVGLAMVHHLLAFAPLVLMGALYALSWRVEALVGHWPLPYRDNPNYVAGDDLLAYLLLACLFSSFMLTVFAFPLLPALTWLSVYRNRRSRYKVIWSALLTAAFIAGLLLFKADPADRFGWLMS
jgi:hypothetical protein